MSVFRTYLAGLTVAHIAWLYFFTTGRLLQRRSTGGPRWFCLADLVITSVAGMALSGFGLLFLGFTHLLNLRGIFGMLLAEGILFWWIKGENCLSWAFWGLTFKRFIKAWTLPAFFIYLLFLVLCVPAVLPPTAADPTTYHLPYAVDWANAGRIYVDPFLRFPYYANNFLLFYSALFVLKLGDYSHFLTWLCGLLTCFGVLAFFSDAGREGREVQSQPLWVQPHQFLIPLSVAFSQLFLHYLNVGMPDVPIALFILIPILCAYRTLLGQALQGELVVTAAFCVGMKLTLIGHLPFFLVSLLFVSAHCLRRRQTAMLSLLLVVLSLPWYVRNFVDCHDPIPPVLNLYFDRVDPIFTKVDSQVYTVAATVDTQPLHLLLLPFRFFIHPDSPPFREASVNAMILFLYGPILFFFGLLYFRERWPFSKGVSYVSACVVYLAVPWIFISNTGRYSIHWYPMLAAWVGIVVSELRAQALAVWHLPYQMRMTQLATAVFCCCLLIPTPSRSSVQFYKGYYETITSLFRRGVNLQNYLRAHVSGYSASQAVIATLLWNQKCDTKVLLLPDVQELAFFLRKAKIISVGDYFGPAGYLHLIRAIQDGNCLSYLTQFDISAVITPQRRAQPLWPMFYHQFRMWLIRCGYKQYRCSEDNIAVFLRNDITPGSQLISVTQ